MLLRKTQTNTTKMSKFFPIKTETACQLKWTWSTIYLHSGTTNSCHRVGLNDIDPDNFAQFHNTPKKLSDRQLMLAGKWPTGGCEYCEKIETAGGSSDRMFHLTIPNMSPPELDADATAVAVTPRIVEVYFDNTCNMSCIYCWDGFSSQIQQENIRFGRFEKDGMVIENRSKRHPDVAGMTEKFWHWLDKNYLTTRRLHILGGEPFYQQQFDHCLEFLSARSNPELEYNIVSNLKFAPKKIQEKKEAKSNQYLLSVGHSYDFNKGMEIDFVK